MWAQWPGRGCKVGNWTGKAEGGRAQGKDRRDGGGRALGWRWETGTLQSGGGLGRGLLLLRVGRRRLPPAVRSRPGPVGKAAAPGAHAVEPQRVLPLKPQTIPHQRRPVGSRCGNDSVPQRESDPAPASFPSPPSPAVTQRPPPHGGGRIPSPRAAGGPALPCSPPHLTPPPAGPPTPPERKRRATPAGWTVKSNTAAEGAKAGDVWGLHQGTVMVPRLYTVGWARTSAPRGG